jgi:hypothetical protein
MKLYITIKQQNTSFDKKYADQYNFGKESNDNQKYNWSYGFKVPEDVIEFNIVDEATFRLFGRKENNEAFDFLIPGVTVINCLTSDNKQIHVAALSKNLIKKKQITPNNKYETVRLYFYLDDKIDFVQPSKAVYIDSKAFPKELLKEQN